MNLGGNGRWVPLRNGLLNEEDRKMLKILCHGHTCTLTKDLKNAVIRIRLDR